MSENIWSSIDAIRNAQGYLTVAETLTLKERGNMVLDPFSTLIGREVQIGEGNIFYPNCVVHSAASAHCTIGSRNTFNSLTMIRAQKGSVSIGDDNQFGPGGFSAIADQESASIHIRSRGRFTGGVQVFSGSYLGEGAQCHGQIVVMGCHLGDGMDYTEPDPDLRGGVLKGMGSAKGLRVEVGEVIAAQTTLQQQSLQRQLVYHPRK